MKELLSVCHGTAEPWRSCREAEPPRRGCAQPARLSQDQPGCRKAAVARLQFFQVPPEGKLRSRTGPGAPAAPPAPHGERCPWPPRRSRNKPLSCCLARPAAGERGRAVRRLTQHADPQHEGIHPVRHDSGPPSCRARWGHHLLRLSFFTLHLPQESKDQARLSQAGSQAVTGHGHRAQAGQAGLPA